MVNPHTQLTPSQPAYDAVLRIPDSHGRESPTTSSGKRGVGIVEIARMAGVSNITVSRVLRNPNVVSEKTREKVRAIIRRTGYVSHPYARALRVGHSSLVLAFVSSMISPQYSVAMQHCSDLLEAHDYQLLTGLTSYSYPKETAGISTLRAIRPAAVLFTGVIELERNRQALRDLGVPILESWAYPRDPIDMLMGFSNYDCGRLAATYIYERGCRRVLFIGRQGGRGKLRQKGFLDTATACGMTVIDSILLEPQNLYNGRAVYQRIKPGLQPQDGIFCANDVLSLSLFEEIKNDSRRGRPRPTLVGFGDIPHMTQAALELPVVGMDSALLGTKMAHMILARLQGNTAESWIDYVPVQIHEPS
ncbi:MAG: LacI family transcriptional regulator [Castellaniella sp.]|uniref:LacI family DNA-binding transcriptional regulator n=1 Tax=Castellaniella sp. TaxID=1955812 RepID=UPI001219020F|nr:LacI family DNA-binding transcriptional regulator [Castellaniella sp.]TAN25826.1 MAG: LacI family transcriptional regulator [Castellaniella sp.]